MTEHQEVTKQKILIVEDEAIIALDLKSHLEQTGYTVLGHVNSAEKALELVEQDRPDLVLMDIILKGKMDGIEAADIIRSRWGIPVIFLTAYADRERLERAKLVYPFGYIIKPFQDNDLKITVEMALYVSKVDRERRKAEQVLRGSEKKYHELFDFLPIPVYEMDLETNITSVNRATYETFRGSEEDLKRGLKAWQLISPEEIEKSNSNIERMIKGEPVEETEYTLRRLDGSVFPAIVISNTIYKDGKPVGLRGAIIDITDRKRAEDSLRESEEKFRTIFDRANDGILIADAETKKFLQGNPAVCFLLGYTKEEIKNLTVHDIHPPEDLPRVLDQFEKQIKGEIVLAENLPVLRKDGSIFYADISSALTIIGGRHYRTGVFRDITERKQAEEALAEAARMGREWQSTFDATNDAIWILDQDQQVLRSNKTAELFFHRPFEELIGKHCWEIVHGTEQPIPECPLLRVRKSLRRETMDLQVGDRWFQVSVDPILDAAGRYSGAVHIISDITERKRAEEILLYEKQLSDSTINSLPGIFYLFDDQGGFQIWNKNFEKVSGYSAEEMSKMHPLNFFTDEDRQRVEQAIQNVFIKGESTVEAEFVSKDRHRTPYLFTGVRITIGNKNCLVGMGIDISDRKQSERTLRESEEKFKAAFEGSHDAITITSKAGKVLDCNRRALEIYGLESKEIFLEKRPADFSPQLQPDGRDSHQASQEIINKVLQKGGFSDFQWLHQRTTGETFPAEITLTSYQLGGEAVLQANIRDITKSKRAEEERDKLQEQLFQAQKIESVGRLAGGVAHDFNNLLTAIIGNAEMALMDEDKEGSTAEVLGEIIKAGERAAGLTRQLLAFSRKQVIQPEVTDLNEVVSEMANILRRLIGEDIELTIILALDPGRVEVDVGQIDQVIMNLAVNARDSMPGGGKLTIETADVELDEEYAAGHVAVRPGPYVLLSVSDNGIGMTPEVQEQIFEPFFTTKEKGRGTGLGLATVYGIIKQSRGNIWVYSEPGQGTTFKIYLPRLAKSVEEVKRPGPKAEFRGGSETVLLVEDEEGIRNLAFKMLQRFGYHVLTAKDGQEASELFERHGDPIDLLLTDVVMPRMSGRELAERLEGLQTGIKVLFMSGYTDNAIVHHGILDKGIAFIQKPFTPEDLVRKVREVLDS